MQVDTAEAVEVGAVGAGLLVLLCSPISVIIIVVLLVCLCCCCCCRCCRGRDGHKIVLMPPQVSVNCQGGSQAPQGFSAYQPPPYVPLYNEAEFGSNKSGQPNAPRD